MSPSEDRKPAGSQEPESRKDKDVSTEQLGKLIEEARQAVKPVIKRELEGEAAGEDVPLPF